MNPTASAQLPPVDADVPDIDFLRVLERRATVRAFRPDPIPDKWIDALLAAGQRAPSSSNIQACTVIVVRDPQTRARLSPICGGQRHIEECPVFLAFCADLTRAASACEMQGLGLDQTLEIGLVATIDAALVAMTVSLAAEAMGLGSVFIGALRNNTLEAAKILGLPPQVYAPFGMCLGWPAAHPAPKPRMPMPAFAHAEAYDASTRESALAAYDHVLAEYYRSQGRETPEQGWTRPTAKAFSVERRKHLRAELQALGFPLA